MTITVWAAGLMSQGRREGPGYLSTRSSTIPESWSPTGEMFRKIRELLGFSDSPRRAAAGRASSTSTSQSADDQPESNAAESRDSSKDDSAATRAASVGIMDIERIGSVTVATFTDSRIIDHDRIFDTGHALESLLEETVTGVVLDFGRVEFISSEMLARLIVLSKQCSGKSIDLRLCSIAPEIYEVFEITRLSKILVIDQNRTASLSRFLAPKGFPFPSSDADWNICADWWEEKGDHSIAEACRDEANRHRSSRPDN